MKYEMLAANNGHFWSPSARKVWIEIKNVSAMLQAAKRRLQQGRSGLKYDYEKTIKKKTCVAFRKEGVD